MTHSLTSTSFTCHKNNKSVLSRRVTQPAGSGVRRLKAEPGVESWRVHDWVFNRRTLTVAREGSPVSVDVEVKQRVSGAALQMCVRWNMPGVTLLWEPCGALIIVFTPCYNYCQVFLTAVVAFSRGCLFWRSPWTTFTWTLVVKTNVCEDGVMLWPSFFFFMR